jgi:4-hydroxy-2-oxoheptanedioate aldolase
MPAPPMADRLRSGEFILTAWVGLPEPLIAELVARAGFDCVTLDMQHALQDTASVMRGLGAIAFGGKPSFVRLAVADFVMASRSLDMGADGVIAPMINSVADAKAFVAATKYPPLGERSWGPVRAMTLRGIPDPQTQLRTANQTTLAIAMIETRQAMDALDDILAVDGIDGIFMGPSDLSVTLSDGKTIGPTEKWLDDPIRDIARRTRAAGKIAGAFAINAERARQFRDFGYSFVALGSDQVYLAEGMKMMLAAARAAS